MFNVGLWNGTIDKTMTLSVSFIQLNKGKKGKKLLGAFISIISRKKIYFMINVTALLGSYNIYVKSYKMRTHNSTSIRPIIVASIDIMIK